MIIGLRVVLLIGILVVLAPLIAYVITRNVRFYHFALKAGKITLGLLAAIGLIYLVERLLLTL